MQVVALTGPAPSKLPHTGLGIFEMRSERVNGAPSYVMMGNANILLWRNIVGSCWIVGERVHVGTNRGALRARDGAATPDGVSAAWEFQDGPMTWAEAPDVTCVARTELEEELNQAASSIGLVGDTPDRLQRDCLGLFEATGKRANGYPIYALAGSDGADLLWHAGSVWVVGNREDLGSSVGGLLAYDGALRPERVKACWAVIGSQEQWVSASGVKVLVGAALDFELSSAAHTVALAGATPHNLQRSFVGVFVKLPNRINGLPTYRGKGGGASNVLMWHSASCWFVGSITSTRGMLRARDGALRPECVRATWEVWDERSDSWVEAPDLRCLPKHHVVRAVEEMERGGGVGAVPPVGRGGLRRTASAVGRLQQQTRAPMA